jgi:RNA polymerase sigma-70 factor (ECF subfamily)
MRARFALTPWRGPRLSSQDMAFGAAASVSRETDEAELRLLVEAATRDDRVAFAALYSRFARTVHGILLSRIPRTDVEDLVHDVFVAALQQLPQLREPAAFSGWLCAIARNRATDFLRRTPRVVELPDDLAAAPADAGEARFVLDEIRRLPEAYRETLILRLVEGMTGPEIAVRTGLTEGSVRVNLHRGMKHLRGRLERRGA